MYLRKFAYIESIESIVSSEKSLKWSIWHLEQEKDLTFKNFVPGVSGGKSQSYPEAEIHVGYMNWGRGQGVCLQMV